MANEEIPKFKSLEEERAFWQTHDAFEVLGEEGWESVEGGMTPGQSFYVVRVGKQGALVYIPKALLDRIGIKKGQKIRAWTEGERLVLEALRK